MGYKVVHTVLYCVIFQFLTMFNTIVEAGAVGTGAASRYGSGFCSDQKMRLRLRNTGKYFQSKSTLSVMKIEKKLK
jgi:hypothetical protein